MQYTTTANNPDQCVIAIKGKASEMVGSTIKFFFNFSSTKLSPI